MLNITWVGRLHPYQLQDNLPPEDIVPGSAKLRYMDIYTSLIVLEIVTGLSLSLTCLLYHNKSSEILSLN
jgi:hypothetical protein